MTSTPDTHIGERARARRLRTFLNDCAGSGAAEEIDRVREAVHELALDVTGKSFLDVDAVHAMLDSGAAMSAVLELMGSDIRFMLSRGAHDSCLASVLTNEGTEESLAEGPTLALALLGAHVAAVLARIERGTQLTEAHSSGTSLRLH